MEKDTTIIDLQNEFRIKIEKPSEFSNSLFTVAYNDAYNKLLDILDYNSRSENHDNFDSYSNIICFTGERGRGKTSTMVSLKNSLTEKSSKKELEIYFEKSQQEQLLSIIDKNFISLPVIDPSLFRGRETLLEIIMAQMFSKFREKIENEKFNSQIDNGLKKKLILSFQEIYKKIQALNNEGKNFEDQDPLDSLLKIADSTNLRAGFSSLVGEYLKFFDSDFLIISLDDIDFKIEQNYSMMEDIRQVLINNKIILLAAFKYEQLFESINNHFKGQLKMISNNLSEERSQLYLNKIFPKSRCIEINEINKIFDDIVNDIVIRKGSKEIFNSKANKNNIYHGFVGQNFRYFGEYSNLKYESVIREILWRDSEIILPLKENRQNLLLPKTIRQLLEFFRSATSINDRAENLCVYLETLLLKEDYKNYLLRLRLCSRDYFKLTFISIVKDIINIDAVDKNLFNVEKLKLLLNANNESNISVGDIASLLFLLEYSHFDNCTALFKDILEFYFSLQVKIKNINFYSSEIYNGVVNLKTNNDWLIIHKDIPFDKNAIQVFHYLGRYDSVKNYREEFESPFNKKNIINTRNAVFTPLSLFGNLSYNDIVNRKYNDKKNWNDDNYFYNNELIYNPIIIKQFLINYIKNKKDISKIETDLNNMGIYLVTDETNKDYNYLKKLYLDCTFRVVDAMNFTLEGFGLSSIPEKIIFDRYPFNLFSSQFDEVEGYKMLLISQIEIIQRRLEILLFNEHKFDAKSDVSKKSFRRKISNILKTLEVLLKNNLSESESFIDELKLIDSSFEEFISSYDLHYYYDNVNSFISKVKNYLKDE